MRRLIEGTGKNSPEEYDQVFLKRQENDPDDFDVKRWRQLLYYYRGGKLIDLGCLDSLVPSIAHHWYPKSEIWGIDLAKEALKQMKEKFPFVYYQEMDVYKTDFPNNYFDYAVAGEIIEHLEDPEKFIKEAFRILKVDGMLALSTPLKELLGGVDQYRHLWSFELEDIRKLLSPYGKVKIYTLGSQFFPWYRYSHDIILAYMVKKQHVI